uniref:Phosphatidylinositol transfer protein beta isoform n=1 Tax=Buteo japonicus TaxID=224669 RepID=A0A8C0HHN5_9AVES
MCAYKLVTIKFKWWGLQNKVENFIQKQEKRIFTNFHRQLFCWIDKWIDLTMEDIRRMEDETQKELEAVRTVFLRLMFVCYLPVALSIWESMQVMLCPSPYVCLGNC